jgi:hypothetical protein
MTGRHLRMQCGLLGLAIALGGCVYSVESTITESSVTFDPRLLGAWEEVDGSDRAVVTRSASNRYAIEYASRDTVRYEARLGRLGDWLILDVSVPPERGPAKPSGEPAIAWHLTYVLDVGEDEIRVAVIAGDSLAAAIRAGRVQLDAQASSAHCPQMCAPADLTLHSTTEELRAALGPYLASAGALERTAIFRRVPGVRKAAPAPGTHADSTTI